MRTLIGPVVLGEGVPAFDRKPGSLELLGTRTWDGSSNVLLRYAVRSDD